MRARRLRATPVGSSPIGAVLAPPGARLSPRAVVVSRARLRLADREHPPRVSPSGSEIDAADRSHGLADGAGAIGDEHVPLFPAAPERVGGVGDARQRSPGRRPPPARARGRPPLTAREPPIATMRLPNAAHVSRPWADPRDRPRLSARGCLGAADARSSRRVPDPRRGVRLS